MYSIVKRLRTANVRRPDREIQSDNGHIGHLTMCSVEGRSHLKLHAAGDSSHMRPIIPELVDARLVAMHGDKMLFAGKERLGGRFADQEWSVRIGAPQPDVPQQTTRLG